MKTALPTEREMKVNGNFFSQSYDFEGANDNFNGTRLFTSYGDRIGKFGFQVFYNRLQNFSQPQAFNRDEDVGAAGGEPVVSGAFRGMNEVGESAITFGNSGPQEVNTNLFKFKGGYEFSSNWDTRLTLAYENRKDNTDSSFNYLKDSGGQPIWGDGNNRTTDAQFGGEGFNVRNDLFEVSQRVRESLFAGWELGGRLGENWYMDATVSRFNVINDTAVDSNFNPSDPLNDDTGVITAFNSTGWTTVDLKFENPVFLGNYDLSLVTGYHFSAQQIGLDQFASPNYLAETRGNMTNRGGGKTAIQGVFAQLGWRFHPDFELTLGARQESWSMTDGFALRGSTSVVTPEREASAFSPKFSLGWEPASRLRFQYSFGLAHRFPLPEELYDNQVRTSGSVLGDASLEPEDGVHHNLSLQVGLGSGHIEANLFQDDVDNTIFTQFQFIQGARIFSFLPVDNVLTRGLEVVLDQQGILGSNFDLQINTTILKSEIMEHALKSSWVGNDFPRMPRVRIGMFAVYNFNPRWMMSLGGRYSSNQFGDLDNGDIVDNVFGSIDSYLFLDTKVSYRLPTGGRFSLGVSNLTNEIAFVHHPWPQRTVFMEFALDIGNDLMKAGS